MMVALEFCQIILTPLCLQCFPLLIIVVLLQFEIVLVLSVNKWLVIETCKFLILYYETLDLI